MTMNKYNTRTFTRRLFAGMLETIRLHKRGDDQLEGTITVYTNHQARKSLVTKTGEPIQGPMASSHRIIWHLPRRTLACAGITHINAADMIEELEDNPGRFWQPESTTNILVKMFQNELDIFCLMLRPGTSV